MLNRRTITKILTFLVVVYPIFFRYQSLTPVITISETVLMLMMVLCLCMYKTIMSINRSMYFFWFYLIIRTMVSVYDNNIYDAVGTGMRLVFLYFAITFVIPYFDYEKGVKYLNIIAVVVCIYGLLQVVLYRFGFLLPTELPFFNAYRDAYSEMQSLKELGFPLRIRSLFGEPSELCHYLFLPLTINLFKRPSKYWYVLSILYSVVSIISLSSTAIVVVAIIWLMYIFDYNQKKDTAFFVTLLLLFVGALVVIKTGIWDYFIFRVFDGGTSISNSTRFKTLGGMFDASDNIQGILFGAGMAEPKVFLPGFARLYLWLGIVGVVVYAIYLINLFKQTQAEGKKIWVVFCILNCAAAVMFGEFALIYLVFVWSCGLTKKKQGD